MHRQLVASLILSLATWSVTTKAESHGVPLDLLNTLLQKKLNPSSTKDVNVPPSSRPAAAAQNQSAADPHAAKASLIGKLSNRANLFEASAFAHAFDPATLATLALTDEERNAISKLSSEEKDAIRKGIAGMNQQVAAEFEENLFSLPNQGAQTLFGLLRELANAQNSTQAKALEDRIGDQLANLLATREVDGLIDNLKQLGQNADPVTLELLDRLSQYRQAKEAKDIEGQVAAIGEAAFQKLQAIEKKNDDWHANIAAGGERAFQALDKRADDLGNWLASASPDDPKVKNVLTRLGSTDKNEIAAMSGKDVRARIARVRQGQVGNPQIGEPQQPQPPAEQPSVIPETSGT